MTAVRDRALVARLEAHGLDWIVPDWPAPSNVHAVMTTRNADAADGVRHSMNLGRVTADTEAVVERNRTLLREVTGVAPLWLSQTHGIAVVNAGDAPHMSEADAAIATRPGRAATVRVADCMPVLFASRDGLVVGAAHAGWRGLCAGVLEATVDAMRRAVRARDGGRHDGRDGSHDGSHDAIRDDIVAWMGPAIGPESFEVGDDVLRAFVERDSAARDAFVECPGRPGKWLADLYALARMRLRGAGIDSISGGESCTVRDAGRFFSHRRDQSIERMAALIWLE